MLSRPPLPKIRFCRSLCQASARRRSSPHSTADASVPTVAFCCWPEPAQPDRYGGGNCDRSSRPGANHPLDGRHPACPRACHRLRLPRCLRVGRSTRGPGLEAGLRAPEAQNQPMKSGRAAEDFRSLHLAPIVASPWTRNAYHPRNRARISFHGVRAATFTLPLNRTRIGATFCPFGSF